MPALQHSFKTLRREWRSGELRLIAAALVVAVAAVTAVTLFTDRVRRAMLLRANTLLAADLTLDSSFPIPEPYLEEARRLGLKTGQTLSFRSMLVVGERMQLVEVKAVDRSYPLRGRLAVARDPFAIPVPTDDVPEPGTAWPDAQLAQVLKLAGLPPPPFCATSAAYSAGSKVMTKLPHITAYPSVKSRDWMRPSISRAQYRGLVGQGGSQRFLTVTLAASTRTPAVVSDRRLPCDCRDVSHHTV